MPTYGTLADLDLLTLTQILCYARCPAALELRQTHSQGWLYFENGQVAHATLGVLTGEPALLALLRWRSGEFRVISSVHPPCQTLELAWPQLSELLLQLPPTP